MWQTSVLLSQLDFVYLTYGLVFLVLATECLSRLRLEGASLPWGWLGLFGLVHGLHEWLDGNLIYLPDSLPFHLLRLLFLAGSFLLLAEFVRRGFLRHFPNRVPGPWILALPVLLTAAAFLATHSLNTSVVRLCLGAPVVTLAALVFFLTAHRLKEQPKERVPFRLAGLMLLGYALAVSVPQPSPQEALAGSLPDNQVAFCIGMPLVRALLIAILAMLIRVHFYSSLVSNRGLTDALSWSRRWPWYILLAFILAQGFYFTNRASADRDQEKRHDRIRETCFMAASLDTAHIAALTGRPADAGTPAFTAVRNQLRQFISVDPQIRFLYLMAPQNNRLVFLVDAEPETSPDYSPPGQPYTNGDEKYWQVLRRNEPQAFGPYADPWGRWVTACVPIRTAPDSKAVALLGMDIAASDWAGDIAMVRRPRLYLTMALVLVPLSGFLFAHRQRATTRMLDTEIRRFQTVFDAVNDAITIHDFDTGDILQANRRAYEMAGYQPGETAGLGALPFSAQPEAPFDTQAAAQRLSQAAAGQPQLFEWRARHRDGHAFWIEVSLQRVTFGLRPRLMAVVRDIDARKRAESELRRSHAELESRIQERTLELARANASLQEDINGRKRAESALRESESRFRALAEVDSSAIIIYQDDRFIYANPGAEKITGYSSKELLGMNWWSIVHPEHRDIVRQRGQDRLSGKVPQSHYPVKITTRSGEERWLFAGACPITAGGRSAVVVTCLDITELRRLETEREQLNERLATHRRLESLGAMAGGIAHDFNNLLLAVLGNAELVQRALPPGSPLLRQVQDIHTAGRRAAEISGRMLIYAGGELFNGQTVDLSVFLRDTLPGLAANAGTANEFRREIPSRLPPILGDPSMIRQMLVSLLTNAGEALGDTPGEVIVRAGHLTLTEQDVNSLMIGSQFAPGHAVFVQVADSGPGMTPEVRSHLFDPFFSTKFIGRGLGLPAVFGMMRAHHGAIRVESAPGQGATVTLYFPCQEPAPATA
ncbi:MAG: PAS domain S-box protein [Lentisphaeria bacterium]